MTLRSAVIPLLSLVPLVGGCAPSRPTTRPPAAEASSSAPPGTAASLFAAQRDHDALRALERELALASSDPERARLELLRALVLHESGTPEHKLHTVSTLRRIGHDFDATPPGRLARMFADQIFRGDVLEQAVMRAGAAMRETEERLRRVEGELTETRAERDEQAEALALAREEHTQLLRSTRELEARSEEQRARIAELEEELAALKQIDMQRQP